MCKSPSGKNQLELQNFLTISRQNFLGISRMSARLIKVSALQIRFSNSLDNRRRRLASPASVWKDLEAVGGIRTFDNFDGKLR
jgi:hypothetical protein